MTRPGTGVLHPHMLDQIAGVVMKAMPDVCVVTRPAGQPVWNETALREQYPAPSVVFTGACRVQPVARNERHATIADQQVTIRRYDIHLPPAADVQLDDTVTVTVSRDPQLVGQLLHVVDVLPTSLETERVVVGMDVDDLGTWRSANG